MLNQIYIYTTTKIKMDDDFFVDQGETVTIPNQSTTI